MDFYKEIACQEIGSNVNSLIKLGDLIWNLAETGFETQKSCEAICKILEKNWFHVTRDFRGVKSTFTAEYGHQGSGSQRGANIGILCRYDAVPKRGHVRGTNLIAEVAVAAALGLKAVISSTADKLGKVTVIGCPNREGGGLVPLLRLRVFKGLDIVLAATPGPRTVWHPIYFGSVTYKALYHGVEGNKEKAQITTNAMDASMLAYTKMLAMQEHFGKGWKAEGSIAQPGSIWVDRHQCQTLVKLTAPTNPDLGYLQRRVVPCLKSAAKATGCQVDINEAEHTIHSLLSNVQLGYLLQLNAYHCGVLAKPPRPQELSAPSDVAEVSRVLPTVRPHFYIGTDAMPGTDTFKEAARTTEAHHCALAMAKALAMTAIDVLHTPGMLSKVKDELKRSLKAEEERSKFAPFPYEAPVVNPYLVKTELPADTGAVGWAKQAH